MTADPTVHHIAIVVHDLDSALKALEQSFGVLHERVPSPAGQALIAFARFANCDIEVVQPLDDDHPLMSWLTEHGPGIHHIAIGVANIEEALQRLDQRSVPSGGQGPKPGARKSRIANLPSDYFGGTQFQLVEDAE